jgi:predicted N-acyltransferase
MENYTFKVKSSLSDINKDNWNSCANNNQNEYNPFISYEFLYALEKSHSINHNTGWNSSYLILENEKKEILGCMPSFIKTNSMGEYVFDHDWANAYHRTGNSYYPKIQVSIPYTPVTGRRFLIKDELSYMKIIEGLSSKLLGLVEQIKASSAHITFLTKEEAGILKRLGWLIRKDQQFHWKNNNYNCFDDFLNELSSRKRKNIKKERQLFNDSSIEIEHITGEDIQEFHWDFFYKFYLDTTMKKWGQAYLNVEFFKMIGRSMKENILLVMAKRKNKYIAGALNFIGSNNLYGRNWGCIEDHKFLHFELCYYQAIEFAIKNNLKIVEAGAQGTHKISRGYSPETTYSAHWIREKNFSDAIEEYLKYEIKEVEKSKKILETYLPYKRGD